MKKHEKRRTGAPALGGSGPEAPGGPLRPSGKPAQSRWGVVSQAAAGLSASLKARLPYFRKRHTNQEVIDKLKFEELQRTDYITGHCEPVRLSGVAIRFPLSLRGQWAVAISCTDVIYSLDDMLIVNLNFLVFDTFAAEMLILFLVGKKSIQKKPT